MATYLKTRQTKNNEGPVITELESGKNPCIARVNPNGSGEIIMKFREDFTPKLGEEITLQEFNAKVQEWSSGTLPANVPSEDAPDPVVKPTTMEVFE